VIQGATQTFFAQESVKESQWAKSPKNSQKEECIFVNSTKYTPTDCFFGNFAHWDMKKKITQQIKK